MLPKAFGHLLHISVRIQPASMTYGFVKNNISAGVTDEDPDPSTQDMTAIEGHRYMATQSGIMNLCRVSKNWDRVLQSSAHEPKTWEDFGAYGMCSLELEGQIPIAATGKYATVHIWQAIKKAIV